MAATLSRKLGLYLLRLLQRSCPPGTLGGNFLKVLHRLRDHFQRGGWRKVGRNFISSLAILGPSRPERAYRRWIRVNEPPSGPVETTPGSANPPHVSLLMPLPDNVSGDLQTTLKSVRDQSCPGWELLLIPGPRPSPELLQWLKAQTDSRIRCISSGTDLPLNGANAGLREARGEFIAFLEPGDGLAPFAIAELARAKDGLDLIYGDEDTWSKNGRSRPIFKPDWSPEMFLGENYLGRATFIRRQFADRLRPEYAGAEVRDLLLRVTEKTQRIGHIPRILYHRKAGGRPEDGEVSRRVLAEHLQRRGIPARVESVPGERFSLTWPITDPPLVSIIIPSRNRPDLIKTCVNGILEKTAYSSREIIIVDNHSTEGEVLSFYHNLENRGHARVAPFDRDFNYSAACNSGARLARGSLLLFLNNDIEVFEPGWLEEMVRWALWPGIGVVGAKLLYANRRIQHAGVVLHGRPGENAHIFRSLEENTPTLFGSFDTYRNYLAVTGACQMIGADLFREVGGYDEDYHLCFSDLVLCLRARQRGRRVVYTPHARLFHHECSTRGFSDPKEIADWQRFSHFVEALQLDHDPYFHPGLKVILSQPEL